MQSNKSLISLFTGAGGLDLGLEQAGFNTKVAIEIEPQACETLRQNKMLCTLSDSGKRKFINESLNQKCLKNLNDLERKRFFSRITEHRIGELYLQDCHVLEGDIRNMSSADLSKRLGGDEPFCIAGGPPCQPFSKAGSQKSLDCTKNGDLFFEFVRLVSDLQPKWFIFENVKGMTFTKTDVLYESCQNCSSLELAAFEIRQDLDRHKNQKHCLACGSKNTEWQVRKEPGGSLKIIENEFKKLGYKCTNRVLNAADYGAPQIRERLFIVGSREGINFEWPFPSHFNPRRQSSQQDMFTSVSNLKTWVTMRDAIWPSVHPKYGTFDPELAKLWVKNVVRPHDEPITWSFDRPSPTIGAHQGAKLAFAPQGVPDEQTYRQHWATKGKKMSDTSPVHVEHEYLTDHELLKLQTFPGWWYLHGTRMQRAFQIGNAVPPVLAKAIGQAIISSENLNGN